MRLTKGKIRVCRTGIWGRGGLGVTSFHRSRGPDDGRQRVTALGRESVPSLELCVSEHSSCKGPWPWGFLSINYSFPKAHQRPDSNLLMTVDLPLSGSLEPATHQICSAPWVVFFLFYLFPLLLICSMHASSCCGLCCLCATLVLQVTSGTGTRIRGQGGCVVSVSCPPGSLWASPGDFETTHPSTGTLFHSTEHIVSKRTLLGLPWWSSVLSLQGVRVWSLAGELRSHMPRGEAKKFLFNF